MTIPVHSPYTIEVGLFHQSGGVIYVAVERGTGFYGDKIFSGKRDTLKAAMTAAQQQAGQDTKILFSQLDNTITDWSDALPWEPRHDRIDI